MSESYLSLFINSAYYTEPLAALSLFFLFLGRFLPIIALSPFFGSRVLPHPVKVAFAISMFVVLMPTLVTSTTVAPTFSLGLVLYMIKEMFIGLLLGNIISLPFIIAQSAGIIIDHQRGGASLMVNDPTIQNQSSPIGTLMNLVLIYIFYLIDGPWDFIDAINTSYLLVPPDQFLSPYFFADDSLSWQFVIKMFNTVMVMTTQLATPALIAILMTDSFLGLANRLAPQVQITFLGMPLKSLLGLTVLCLGWKLVIKRMIIQSHYWIDGVGEITKYFDIGAGG